MFSTLSVSSSPSLVLLLLLLNGDDDTNRGTFLPISSNTSDGFPPFSTINSSAAPSAIRGMEINAESGSFCHRSVIVIDVFFFVFFVVFVFVFPSSLTKRFEASLSSSLSSSSSSLLTTTRAIFLLGPLLLGSRRSNPSLSILTE